MAEDIQFSHDVPQYDKQGTHDQVTATSFIMV
jgi:hypothetical protein